jgi:hypothetical protein
MTTRRTPVATAPSATCTAIGSVIPGAWHHQTIQLATSDSFDIRPFLGCLAPSYRESQILNAIAIPAINDIPNRNSANGTQRQTDRFSGRFAPGLADTTKEGWE